MLSEALNYTGTAAGTAAFHAELLTVAKNIF